MATCTKLLLLLCSLQRLNPTSAYGRPAILRGLQPARWVANQLSNVLLPPDGQLGVDMEIRQSPGKGQGLFALRRFEEGEFIGRYTGLFRSQEEFWAGFEAGDTSGDYIFLLANSNIYIDADE